MVTDTGGGGSADPGPGRPDGDERLGGLGDERWDDRWNVTFDEDFVRAATVKEPGARARQLAARWSVEPPRPSAWRGDPDGFGPPQASAKQRHYGRRSAARGPSRETLRSVVIVLVVIAVAVAFIRFWP
jgi:hypothetical protein